MSDFLFSTGRRNPGVLSAALERYLGPVTTRSAEYHGPWGSLAVVEASHDSEVVVEDARSLSVLIGEPLTRVGADAPAGLADGGRRSALHRRLGGAADEAWDQLLDGPFAALVVDKETGAGRVLTDLFAWIPVFVAPGDREGRGLVIGTHVDAVAEAAGLRGNLDAVSVAELLSYFTVTFPHTLYAEVAQLEAGTERGYTAAGWSAPGRSYWQPLEGPTPASLPDAAAELRGAFIDDVAAACAGNPVVGVLLSGGEDSRAVLGAVPAGVSVRGFTYAPAFNREVRSARRVARAYGVPLEVGLREPTHDLVHFEAVARLVGSQNLFLDAHGYALHESLGLAKLPVVLGGFSSDALLKADNVSNRAKASLRRGMAPAPRRWKTAVLPGLAEELLHAATDRRERYRLRLAELRPESADEWCRIYPFSMRKYAGNLHGNRRLFRTHEPFMSNRVVALAASAPQRWKIDRRLFREAMRPLLARSWHVPHSRNRFPFFGARVNLVARPILGSIRAARAAVTGSLGANQESWPLWPDLARSREMREKLRRYPVSESLAAAAVGVGGTDLGQASGDWPPLQRFMLLQLAYLTGPVRRSGSFN